MSTATILMCCILMVLVLCPIEIEFTVSRASASVANCIPFRTDLNGDGAVNIVDLAAIANKIEPSATWNPRFDLNNDGKVNMLDLVVVAKDLGLNMSAHIASGVWNMLDWSLDGISSNDGLIYAEKIIVDRNCTFTAKVKIAEDSVIAEVGLALCIVDSGNFYWAGLGIWGHRSSISKMMNYVPSELASNGYRADVVKDSWYNLRVRISGDTIMLYVNDSLELTATDSSFDGGMVGIRTWNSHVIVDYVTVIGTRVPQSRPTRNVLYADGTSLRDPSGEEVVLKGTMIDYNVLGRDIWFSFDDVQRLKSYGGNALELIGLLFRDMMPQRGVIAQNWVNRLDKWVSWLEQSQMYCIITFGNFEYKPWGPEAPNWFLEGKYSAPWSKDTWNQASLDFWDVDNPLQEDNRQAILSGFQFLSNRYKNYKYVLFGLFDEPFAGNNLVSAENAEHLSITYARFVERIVNTIRSTGAEQLVFVNKPYVWYHTAHFEPVNRDGIVWDDHEYVSTQLDVNQWETLFNKYVQRYVSTFKKPFLVGGYGVYPFSEYNGALSDWRTTLEEQVNFLKGLPICGYLWFEYPSLEGQYYDYVDNYLTKEDSDYILQTIFG